MADFEDIMRRIASLPQRFAADAQKELDKTADQITQIDVKPKWPVRSGFSKSRWTSSGKSHGFHSNVFQAEIDNDSGYAQYVHGDLAETLTDDGIKRRKTQFKSDITAILRRLLTSG